MKLIIQIPCYNEAATLGITLKELPRKVEGFDKVEWLIIDDGSTDDTSKVARDNGADHVVRFIKNQGLAKGFLAGLEACVKLGADVIVNTDADNQYNAQDIPKLVKPILEGKSDIVVGSRPINEIDHFSSFKKILQKIGSWVVRLASNTDLPDATSGFRAISWDAAMQLNLFNDYTYTLEMIIQAGQKGMSLASVPISTNPYLRPSRLIKSIPVYIKNSIITILRIFVVYRPFLFFMTIGASLCAIGFLLGLRFFYYRLTNTPGQFIQSLILASILIGIGFQTILVAFLADLQAVNRKLLEKIKFRLRKLEVNTSCGINSNGAWKK